MLVDETVPSQTFVNALAGAFGASRLHLTIYRISRHHYWVQKSHALGTSNVPGIRLGGFIQSHLVLTRLCELNFVILI